MPFSRLWVLSIIVFGLPSTLPGQFRLTLPEVAVGRNLQTSATVVLSEPVSAAGLDLTVRSSDSTRLLLSLSPLETGAPSVVLHVKTGFRQSPEFWLQARAGEGSVTISAEANAYSDATAKVLLTPSAILIAGPFGAPTFQTTVSSEPSRLTLSCARLDSSFNYAEEQLFAGPSPLSVEIVSSNKAAGVAGSASVALPVATSSAVTAFQPASEGETVLSIVPPAGFSTPVKFAKVTAVVRLPGLALSDQLMIGRDLEVGGVLSLGAPAPKDGLAVLLTSTDPERMLLSDSATQVGSASITITVKPGEAFATYYLQALSETGVVGYKAEAPGFRSRTAAVSLAPAGIVLTPASQGPPDEAHVLRQGGVGGTEVFHTVSVGLKQGDETPLVAWTVQLDPATHRAADITVQPLRAGLAIRIPLINSAPGVGSTVSSVTISGGSEHSRASFKPLSTGSAVISVQTPKGFTAAANSTSVIAVVGP